MDLDALAPWLPVFGRAHPLLLHLPIGLLIGLGLHELLAAIGRRPAAPAFLVFVAAAGAALAAGSGWVLHEEPSYGGGDLLELHETLGIATAACAFVVFVLRAFGATAMYRLALFLTIGVLVPTGHFGAEMTHGKGFLLEPLEWTEEAPAPSEPERDPLLASFAATVQPFFDRSCVECHGPRKVKGDLRLDSAEALLAGGEGGPAIEADFPPEDQELLYRMLLPLDDDDHMPPDHKVQPTAGELAMIRAWLAAGAPLEAEFRLTEALGEIPPRPAAEDESESEAEPPVAPEQAGAPAAALNELRRRLVHVQPIESGSPLLWIDFAAPAAQVDDAFVRETLQPLRDWVAELSLARTAISDDALQTVAAMPLLQRLDLRETAITSSGLQSLSGLPELRSLVLSQTRLDDGVVSVLSAFPALEELWVWNAGMSEAGLSALREALPELRIDAGDATGSAALETEGELEFTSDAPPVDPPAEEVAAAAPINSTCPVSGKPVDPRYTRTHDGKVIGFCCPNCPASFDADPDAYLAKLEPASDG